MIQVRRHTRSAVVTRRATLFTSLVGGQRGRSETDESFQVAAVNNGRRRHASAAASDDKKDV